MELFAQQSVPKSFQELLVLPTCSWQVIQRVVRTFEWLMDAFSQDLSLVARRGHHSVSKESPSSVALLERFTECDEDGANYCT